MNNPQKKPESITYHLPKGEFRAKEKTKLNSFIDSLSLDTHYRVTFHKGQTPTKQIQYRAYRGLVNQVCNYNQAQNETSNKHKFCPIYISGCFKYHILIGLKIRYSAEWEMQDLYEQVECEQLMCDVAQRSPLLDHADLYRCCDKYITSDVGSKLMGIFIDEVMDWCGQKGIPVTLDKDELKRQKQREKNRTQKNAAPAQNTDEANPDTAEQKRANG